MPFWKKQQKPTINKSVVEIEYLINPERLLGLQPTESTLNYNDFLSVYKAVLIPVGEKHIVFVPNDKTGTCFYNKLEAVVDISRITGDDEGSKTVTISWWNLHLHMFTNDGLCNMITPHEELDNLMLFGKTSFTSNNPLISNEQNKLSIPSSYQDDHPAEWVDIWSNTSEEFVDYFNETAAIKIRVSSSPDIFSTSLFR